MLAISKNVLFPGHNHLLTTGTGDPALYRLSTSDIDVSNRAEHNATKHIYGLCPMFPRKSILLR